MPQAFGGFTITDPGQIANGIITNNHISASAAIAKSKLAALAIVNADVDAGAAIAKSKLASLAIVNADVDAGAAIDTSKLSGGISFTLSAVAGEAIPQYASVMKGDGNDIAILSQVTGATERQFGMISNYQKEAQSIDGADVNALISKINIRVRKVNTPTDNLVVQIRQDSQTGTLLATASIGGGSITGSEAVYTITLDTPVQFAAGTTYYLVFTRSGALDDTNYYYTTWVTPSAYSGGSVTEYDGATWNAWAAYDLYFVLLQTTVAGKLYRGRTGVAAHATRIVGVAGSAISNGATGAVTTGGVITNVGWSWTPGSAVYATDTPGVLSHTPGSQSKPVGIALSATELQMDLQ